jgi:hypothetical protein
MVYNNDWKKYIDILKKKKNNIFISNNNNETVYDIINKNDINLFMNMIVDSFLYIMNSNDKYKKSKYLLKKENILKHIIDNKISIPIKKDIYKIEIKMEKISFIPYLGISLDIIFGLLYLKKSFPFIYTSLSKNYIHNQELLKITKMNNILINTKGEYNNFEIFFINNNIVFPDGFENIIINFKKNLKNKFFIIPITI